MVSFMWWKGREEREACDGQCGGAFKRSRARAWFSSVRSEKEGVHARPAGGGEPKDAMIGR